MDRFEIGNIAYKIDGYVIGSPRMTKERVFLKAKGELKKVLENELQSIDKITLEQYESSKKKDFK